MDFGQRILFDFFVMFVAARAGGALLARLGQPPVLGELTAGVVIGPHALGLVGRPGSDLIAALGSAEAARAALLGAYRSVAELGLIFLLFYVGLEVRLADIFHVGAALVATSTAITARTLRDLGVIRSEEARIILGAAVVDDVLSLLILGVLAGLGGAGRSTPLDIVLLVIEALAFVGFVALVGAGLVRRYGPRLSRAGEPNVPFIIAVGICLGLAVLASQVGLSPIVGAFLAGMVLAEAKAHLDIERAAQSVYDLLVPFFFVVVGTEVDLSLVMETEVLGLAVVLTALAFLGKLLGCGAGAWGLGWHRMAIVGIGMVPRGEVGLVVVSLGRALNAIPEAVFSVIVLVTLVTTVVVPPLLVRLYAHRPDAKPSLRGVDQEQENAHPRLDPATRP